MDESSENIIDDAPTGFASAASLVQRVDELERQRELMARQWKLNLSFYKGKQYVFYNRTARRIESLPTDDGDKPRYRVRLVSNQIDKIHIAFGGTLLWHPTSGHGLPIDDPKWLSEQVGNWCKKTF